MNQLNKLIEQWGESKNSPSAASSFKSMIAYEYENGGSPWLDFINFILASRPTCGIEQRKFLDEVERLIYSSDDRLFILQKLFTADIQKVIQGE